MACTIRDRPAGRVPREAQRFPRLGNKRSRLVPHHRRPLGIKRDDFGSRQRWLNRAPGYGGQRQLLQALPQVIRATADRANEIIRTSRVSFQTFLVLDSVTAWGQQQSPCPAAHAADNHIGIFEISHKLKIRMDVGLVLINALVIAALPNLKHAVDPVDRPFDQERLFRKVDLMAQVEVRIYPPLHGCLGEGRGENEGDHVREVRRALDEALCKPSAPSERGIAKNNDTAVMLWRDEGQEIRFGNSRGVRRDIERDQALGRQIPAECAGAGGGLHEKVVGAKPAFAPDGANAHAGGRVGRVELVERSPARSSFFYPHVSTRFLQVNPPLDSTAIPET